MAGGDDIALRTGLEKAELKQERRALRLVAEGLVWEWTDDTTLRLAFALPPGSYATALLQELGEIVDSSKRHNRSSENSAGHWQAPAAGV